MIFGIENVDPVTEVICQDSNEVLQDVVEINTGTNRIYTHMRPLKFNEITEEFDLIEIKCQHIEINYNESEVPNKFIFKRLTDAQP